MSLEWYDGKALFFSILPQDLICSPRKHLGYFFYLYFDMLLFMRRAKEISH